MEPAPVDDVILALEDVAEPAYRVDRLLTQPLRAGHLDRVRGVLVGDLGASAPGAIPPIVADRLGGREIPVVVDAPVGHGSRNVALPLGARVRLDATRPDGHVDAGVTGDSVALTPIKEWPWGSLLSGRRTACRSSCTTPTWATGRRWC